SGVTPSRRPSQKTSTPGRLVSISTSPVAESPLTGCSPRASGSGAVRPAAVPPAERDGSSGAIAEGAPCFLADFEPSFWDGVALVGGAAGAATEEDSVDPSAPRATPSGSSDASLWADADAAVTEFVSEDNAKVMDADR